MLGSQRPRIESRPEAAGSHGDLALRFNRALGVHCDPWQAYALDGLFRYREDGLWAANEFGLLVSRQNGKGNVILPYTLAHLFMFPRPDRKPKTIVHTAHELKTAVEAFERAKAAVEGSHKLSKLVKRAYEGNGNHKIVLHNGNRILFLARTRRSGRGFATDNLIIDEAQYESSAEHDALLYTTSTAPNLQILFTGTVPEDGDPAEEWLPLRDRGRSNNSPGTGWMEWNPAGSESPLYAPTKADLMEPIAWQESIPGLGIRITEKTVRTQVSRSSNLENLKRERFSIWPNPKPLEERTVNEVDLELWHENSHPEMDLGSEPALGLWIGPGAGYATISGASRVNEEQIFIRTLRTAPGILWVPKALKELKEKLSSALIVIDERNASGIVTDLQRIGVKYMATNPGELTGARTGLIESHNAGLVLNRGQVDLYESVRHAGSRKVGAVGETWDQSDPAEPITQVQSATLAHWGLKKAEANPQRKPGTVTGVN